MAGALLDARRGVSGATMIFERAQAVLDEAHRSRVFPAATAEVGTAHGVLWSTAVGRLTFDEAAAPTTPDTVFDLASLTKVLSTATLAALLVDQGSITLDEPLGDFFPEWIEERRAAVTIRDLLEHCSGLPGHRRYFESLTGRPAYETAICREPLVYVPRMESVYSDPGFMLLGFLLETAAGALDAQFEAWRSASVGAAEIAFGARTEWQTRVAPTEQDPWRGRLLVAEVHDENTAALGGVAGHAGLFGTAAAVGACARWWLRALDGHASLSADVARTFARRSSVPGSSRALGWDTMLPTSSCGAHLSPDSIGHTGFTGTSLWIDRLRDLYVVLLTNRVHPTRANEGIQDVRRAFHDAVVFDLMV
jgi:serine-type D-Ala-D-Ala carboxypeptidase